MLKSPSQLVFVSSIAISQHDRIGVLSLWSLPTQNGLGSQMLGVKFSSRLFVSLDSSPSTKYQLIAIARSCV